jgi:hypothetical protein
VVPTVTLHRIGTEGQPVVVIDNFAADPDALRAAAIGATFGPAIHHYPGIRAALPGDYLTAQLPVVETAFGEALGSVARLDVIDASFSIVTTPRAALSVSQRLPHCDAYDARRIAMVHYLSPGDRHGTGFFRHRATGFESVDAQRAGIYPHQVDAELRYGSPPPPDYWTGDGALFERIFAVEAKYNRAIVYPSFLLHSGLIDADASLSPDPASGRLTVTGFFSIQLPGA